MKVAAAADPDRARAPTAASAAPAFPVARAFNAVHGYTTADLLKDRRFKVCDSAKIIIMARVHSMPCLLAQETRPPQAAVPWHRE